MESEIRTTDELKWASAMTKKPMLHAQNLMKFSAVSLTGILSSLAPAQALSTNDPRKVCEIYGCEIGIPISGPSTPTVSRPDEPGRRPPKPVPVRYCVFHEDANFRGNRGWLQLGTAYEYVGKRWNDRISSISCSPRCRLIAYEHRGFEGATREFSESTPFVGVDWNDRISSIRIRCR